MNPLILILLFLQMVFSALAAIRGVLPGCGSCGGTVEYGDFALGMVGALFYFLMWLAAAEGWSRRVVVGMGAAAGVHAALMARMAVEGTFCVWCVLAALGAFVICVLISVHPKTPAKALLLCGLGGALICAVPWVLRRTPATPVERIRITVYESRDCPYCLELRRVVLPPIQHDYAGRLVVRYLSAEGADWVRKLPTLIIEDPLYPEVIEGLPSERYLRGRIEPRLAGREAPR